MQRNIRNTTLTSTSRRFANRTAFHKWYSFSSINLAQGRDAIFALFPVNAESLFDIEFHQLYRDKAIFDIDFIPSADPKGWEEFKLEFDNPNLIPLRIDLLLNRLDNLVIE